MRLNVRVAQCAVAGLLLVVAGVGGTGAAAARPATAEPAPQLVFPWLWPEPPGVQAREATLVDADTGAVRWSRLGTVSAPMGSITKVMTALVVISAGDLDRRITVPASVIAYDQRYDGSTAGLAPGEVLTARQLLYAMLIPSGCDAAYTLAEAYGPGQAGFLAKMNDTARRLGLTGTHFTDPSGLPAPTEYSTYSTPADLVALGLRAMRSPVLRAIVGTQTFHLPAGAGHGDHVWQTTNLLLRDYPGAVGIKTGSTDAAGYCLLFEAVRGGRTLIGVVLNSSSTSDTVAASDAETILDWGFAH
jgi:D-alanyl-D-alanine carboxypeptidase (penicillin-binding protein 5/6)